MKHWSYEALCVVFCIHVTRLLFFLVIALALFPQMAIHGFHWMWKTFIVSDKQSLVYPVPTLQIGKLPSTEPQETSLSNARTSAAPETSVDLSGWIVKYLLFLALESNCSQMFSHATNTVWNSIIWRNYCFKFGSCSRSYIFWNHTYCAYKDTVFCNGMHFMLLNRSVEIPDKILVGSSFWHCESE